MRLVILGSGPLGRSALDYVTETYPECQVLGFITLNDDAWESQVAGHRVLGGLDWLRGNRDVRVVVAVDLPSERLTASRHLAALRSQLVTLVHPSALIGPRVVVEEGVIVGPRVVLTCDVRVGRAAVLGPGAMVGHDGVIGHAAMIASGVQLAGDVVVGAEAEIRTGATVVSGVRIGDRSVVGPGAVVMADVLTDDTVVSGGVHTTGAGRGTR